MCKHLFENEELYKNYIAPLLLDLAYDHIINVRISLSKFIEKIIKKNRFEYLKTDETIRKIVTIFRKDKHKEVNVYMKDLNDIKDIDVELGVYVNDKFVDLMKYVSDEFGITKNVPLESVIRETSNTVKINKNKEDVKKDENTISTSTSENKDNINTNEIKTNGIENSEEKKENEINSTPTAEEKKDEQNVINNTPESNEEKKKKNKKLKKKKKKNKKQKKKKMKM